MCSAIESDDKLGASAAAFDATDADDLDDLDEDWELVKRVLPALWEAKAQELGAVSRQWCGFGDVGALLRVRLIHLAAYLALPPTGLGPGLPLFQEIFGVNRHIRAVAEPYALDGFVVLAPDVFWRQSPRVELGYAGDDRNRAIALMQAFSADSAAVLGDMALAFNTFHERPETSGRKLGAFGYCMGGRLAYLAAASQRLAAASAFCGGGIHGQLDRAASVRCPMQFHFAEHDDHIPPDAVQSVRQAFARPGDELHVYPGAHHGFNCWDRGSYHAASAALAHGRTLAFPIQPLG